MHVVQCAEYINQPGYYTNNQFGAIYNKLHVALAIWSASSAARKAYAALSNASSNQTPINIRNILI